MVGAGGERAGESTYWGPDFGELATADPEIAAVALAELERQRDGLQLIASENFTSPSVLAALPMVADGSQPEFAQELLQLFESELTTALAEIEAAMTKDDGAKLLRCLHTLKSSSAQVGAVELATVTGTFETLQRAGQSPSPTWLTDIQAAASRLQQAQHEHAHRGTEKAT